MQNLKSAMESMTIAMVKSMKIGPTKVNRVVQAQVAVNKAAKWCVVLMVQASSVRLPVVRPNLKSAMEKTTIAMVQQMSI